MKTLTLSTGWCSSCTASECQLWHSTTPSLAGFVKTVLNKPVLRSQFGFTIQMNATRHGSLSAPTSTTCSARAMTS
eukprot:3554291-Rhodomonas_salina.1